MSRPLFGSVLSGLVMEQERPMPLEPFSRYFPEAAQNELLAFSMGSDPSCGDDEDLPEGEYAFFEWYCTEPGCDCRRVMIYAVEKTRGIMAAINYSFDPDELDLAEGLSNPMLDPAHPQGPYAQYILGFFTDRALDNQYIEKLRNHYAMVKNAVDTMPAVEATP
jgi:hypothetical protein